VGVGEASVLALFLLGFLAARILGPVAFGQYAAAVGFVSLFRWVTDLGLGQATTVMVARERERASSAFGPLLGLQLGLSLLAAALCAVGGRAVFDAVTALAVAVLGIELAARGVQSSLRWLLRSFEAFGAESVALGAERLLTLALGLTALLSGLGVAGLVGAMALARVLGVVALWAWAHRRLTPLHPRVDRAAWRRLVRSGLPYAWAALCAAIAWPLDAVLLEQLHEARAAGLYRAPARIVEGLVLLPRVMSFALLPILTRVRDAEPERLLDLYRRGSRYLLLVGGCLAALGVAETAAVIALVFGGSYAPAEPAARLLFASIPFVFGSVLAEVSLAATGQTRALALLATAGAVLKLTLSLALVPRLSIVGAALGTLIVQATLWLGATAVLARSGCRLGAGADVARPALAAGTLWLVLRALSERPLPLAVAGAALASAGAALVLGLVGPREWRLLRELAWPPRGAR
jgi:PST family polysaccharide transporter